MKDLLLDTSFLVDLFREVASKQSGPAMKCLAARSGDRLWISPVTFAEVLEGAEDPAAMRATLARFHWQGIGRAQAERAAWLQRRQSQRLGENDAWQVAIVQFMGGAIVGHDKAFERLGSDYICHRDFA